MKEEQLKEILNLSKEKTTKTLQEQSYTQTHNISDELLKLISTKLDEYHELVINEICNEFFLNRTSSNQRVKLWMSLNSKLSAELLQRQEVKSKIIELESDLDDIIKKHNIYLELLIATDNYNCKIGNNILSKPMNKSILEQLKTTPRSNQHKNFQKSIGVYLDNIYTKIELSPKENLKKYKGEIELLKGSFNCSSNNYNSSKNNFLLYAKKLYLKKNSPQNWDKITKLRQSLALKLIENKTINLNQKEYNKEIEIFKDFLQLSENHKIQDKYFCNFISENWNKKLVEITIEKAKIIDYKRSYQKNILQIQNLLNTCILICNEYPFYGKLKKVDSSITEKKEKLRRIIENHRKNSSQEISDLEYIDQGESLEIEKELTFKEVEQNSYEHQELEIKESKQTNLKNTDEKLHLFKQDSSRLLCSPPKHNRTISTNNSHLFFYTQNTPSTKETTKSDHQYEDELYFGESPESNSFRLTEEYSKDYNSPLSLSTKTSKESSKSNQEYTIQDQELRQKNHYQQIQDENKQLKIEKHQLEKLLKEKTVIIYRQQQELAKKHQELSCKKQLLNTQQQKLDLKQTAIQQLQTKLQIKLQQQEFIHPNSYTRQLDISKGMLGNKVHMYNSFQVNQMNMQQQVQQNKGPLFYRSDLLLTKNHSDRSLYTHQRDINQEHITKAKTFYTP